MKKSAIKKGISTAKAFDLVQEFGKLQGTVEEGFLGINTRLDRLNGNVAKHEEELGKIRNNESYQAGRRKGAWAFWMILGGVITAIISVLTFLATAGYIHS